jgi:hypothetical protein
MQSKYQRLDSHNQNSQPRVWSTISLGSWREKARRKCNTRRRDLRKTQLILSREASPRKRGQDHRAPPPSRTTTHSGLLAEGPRQWRLRAISGRSSPSGKRTRSLAFTPRTTTKACSRARRIAGSSTKPSPRNHGLRRHDYMATLEY